MNHLAKLYASYDYKTLMAAYNEVYARLRNGMIARANSSKTSDDFINSLMVHACVKHSAKKFNIRVNDLWLILPKDFRDMLFIAGKDIKAYF